MNKQFTALLNALEKKEIIAKDDFYFELGKLEAKEKAAAGTATPCDINVAIGGKLDGMCQTVTSNYITSSTLSNPDLAVQLDGKVIVDLLSSKTLRPPGQEEQ